MDPVQSSKSVRLAVTVQRFPELWNNTLPEYNNRTVTEKAWSQVARLTGESVSTCKFKWKNIRDSFLRHLRNSSSDKKPYYLGNILQYLAPYTRTKSRKWSRHAKEYSEVKLEEDESFVFASDEEQLKEISAQNFGSDIFNTSSLKALTESKIPYSKLEQSAMAYFNMKIEEKENDCDGFLHFFKSLLPIIRQLSDEKKRICKQQILDVVNTLAAENNTDKLLASHFQGSSGPEYIVPNSISQVPLPSTSITEFKCEVEESDESILQQLPDLGIVKEEPIDPDIAVVEEPSSSSTVATLPETPASYEVHNSPPAILPDLSSIENPSTVPSTPISTSSKIKASECSSKAAMKRRRFSDDSDDPDPNPNPNSVHSNCTGVRDEFTVFGEFVATKLRNFTLRRNQLLAQNAITQLLNDIDMKDIEKDTYTIKKSNTT